MAEAARRVLEEDSALASKMEASFFGPEGRQSALAVLDKEARLVAEHCFSEWFYNDKRPHMSIDYQTPSRAHEQSGPQERRWKGYQSTLS
ncbi:MAG: hypothetical protein II543_00075, partial [Desulfovibrio sp.]|nr:hypothetical protein [Desulfovibrio sp.]